MSAVLERQISEGYPVEGVPFEPPQLSRDREAPHFVTVLGSTITAAIAADRPWTKHGGIEVHNPCLKFVKHFLRKGRLTPVLKDTYDWVTRDYWEKATGSDQSFFLRPIPRGYVAPDKDEFGNKSVIQPMYGKIAFPADHINAIVNGSSNALMRRNMGVVELKSLHGQPYNPTDLGNGINHDPEIWKIQTTIFPKWPLIPVLLDETEQILFKAQSNTLLRPVIDDMLGSLAAFRNYAAATVEQKHYMMRELGAKSQAGYIPQYDDLDFVLLEQLGMDRQDINIRKSVTPQTDTELAQMQKELVALQLEEARAIAAERRAQRADVPVVDANTMAAAPVEGYSGYGGQSGFSGFSGEVTNATPEGQEHIAVAMSDVERYDCDCGWVNEKNTPQGLSLHQRRYCELEKMEN